MNMGHGIMFKLEIFTVAIFKSSFICLKAYLFQASFFLSLESTYSGVKMLVASSRLEIGVGRGT